MEVSRPVIKLRQSGSWVEDINTGRDWREKARMGRYLRISGWKLATIIYVKMSLKDMGIRLKT